MSSIKQIILSVFRRYRNLILYGIIGVFSAGLDFFVFYLLTSLNVYYLIANVIGVVFGITLSFILNKTFNFRVNNKILKRFLIFFTVGIGGLFLSSGLLYFFIEILMLEKIISKFLSIVFVVLIQFLANKYITFKKEII